MKDRRGDFLVFIRHGPKHFFAVRNLVDDEQRVRHALLVAHAVAVAQRERIVLRWRRERRARSSCRENAGKAARRESAAGSSCAPSHRRGPGERRNALPRRAAARRPSAGSPLFRALVLREVARRADHPAHRVDAVRAGPSLDRGRHLVRIDRFDFVLVVEIAHGAAMRLQFEAVARERELPTGAGARRGSSRDTARYSPVFTSRAGATNRRLMNDPGAR